MSSEIVVHPEDIHPGGALAAVSRESGVMALAFMPEVDFEARLLALKQGQDRVRRIQRELMEEDEDYGVIPGTKKPTLLKPGAEKLCNVYGLVPTYEWETKRGDGITEPVLAVEMKCYLHKGDNKGPILGEGVGAANSWERRYRYRGAQRTCPSCGCEGTIRRSSFERDGDKGWYCHAKSGGCGEQFNSQDPAIVEQERGQVENPDPHDLQNTLLKMARKRSHIDATLSTTATSGLFTQDLEDTPGGGEGHGHDDAATQPPNPAPSRAPQQTNQPKQQPRQQAAQGAPAGERWTGPCPRCGKTGAVIKSRFKAGFLCWTKSERTKGCGYEFTAADAQVHQQAVGERQASGEPFEERSDYDDSDVQG